MDPVAVEACATANQRPYELSWLLSILKGRQPIRRVLEVGVEAGGSLWAWCQVAADDAQIMGIDCEWHSTAFTELLKRHPWPARAGQQLTLLKIDSRLPEAGRAARATFDGPVDFLFIDADHATESVWSDWETYSPLVAPGGLVGFHDVANQASEFWGQFQDVYPGMRTEECVDPANQGMGIGVAYL